MSDVIPKAPKRYRDVRRVLEDWVAGAPSTISFVSRSAKLFQADAKLRAALSGKNPQVLRLAGKTVPDDDTPEARQFRSPAKSKVSKLAGVSTRDYESRKKTRLDGKEEDKD